MTAVMAGCRFRAEPLRMTTHLVPPAHDLSRAAPRPADLLSLVDALAPGQLLTLRLTSETARGLIATLTAERKGLFEWSPEADGNALRVDVMRRHAAPGSKRGVLEALSWDHARIDAFEQGAFAARAAGEFKAAQALFERFARSLFRHIGFEEDVLFPALESAAGLPPHAGPTAVMRAEHIEIRAAVQLLRDAIGDPSADPAPLRHRLHGTLEPHSEKEERILYPMADRVLSGSGSDELVAAIQAYEADLSSDAVLDVRPDIARGEEPLSKILTAARGIEPGGQLVVQAPFVPLPLFGVLAKLGFENETENLGPEGFRITFRRTAARAAGEP